MGKERKLKEERIMPSLVATTSALASTTCVRTHYVRTNKLVYVLKVSSSIDPIYVEIFWRNPN